MTDNPFIGSWKLISFEFRRSDGQVTYPFGQDLQGYIFYNPDGYMSVDFMRNGRPNFQSEGLFSGSIAEKALAYEQYLSYCGRYEIRPEQIIHHIEVSLFPNWTGQDQIRFYQFEGDRLTLSTPPMLVDGLEQTAQLIWQRAK